MPTPSDQSGSINALAEAITSLTEDDGDRARERAAAVYAATADWVPDREAAIETLDFKPQIVRSVAASILALSDGDHPRGKDLAEVAFAFTVVLSELELRLETPEDAAGEIDRQTLHIRDLAEAVIFFAEGDRNAARDLAKEKLWEIELKEPWDG